MTEGSSECKCIIFTVFLGVRKHLVQILGYIFIGSDADERCNVFISPSGSQTFNLNENCKSSYHEYFKHNGLLIALQQAHHTVPVVFKLLIAPLLCKSKFQTLYLSEYMSAFYCIISYGGGERWRWSEKRRERKRQERSWQ